MKELEVAMQVAFDRMVKAGKLDQIVEAKVQKAVEEVVSDAFSYNSPFRESLKEHLKNNITVDLSSIGLGAYNDFILKVIKAKLDASVFRFAEKQIGETMDKLLKPAPVEIKLSELVEQFKEFVHNDEDRDGGISCHIESSETISGYSTVRLDSKPRVAARDCRYDIALNKNGEVYRIALPYTGDITKKIFAGPFYRFEQTLFQLYAAKTRLILDEDDVNCGCD